MPVLPEQVFVPESSAEIRDMMLSDHRLEAAKSGSVDPVVLPETDDFIFYTAVANGTFVQYGNIALIRPAITPLNATGDDLEAWRVALQLPKVEPSGSAGLMTVTLESGTGTLTEGQELTLPNGRRIRVVGPHVGISDGADVTIEAVDVGEDTNADAGTPLQFFPSAPANFDSVARVSINGPLTGGSDAEDEGRLRDRILNKLANSPGGGNWGQAREKAFNELPSVTGNWVYPALGGPASFKQVIAKSFDRERNDYTRAMATAAVNKVRDVIHREMPDGIEKIVTTVGEEAAPLAIKIKIPSSALSGGDGRGWLDAAPWPTATGNKTTVTVVGSDTSITVDHSSATSPVAGQTRIAWWSPRDMRFRVFTVLTVGGGSGAWVLGVDSPMVDSTNTRVAVGEYISPAAVNLEAYGNTLIDMFEALACGENTSDSNRTPRALRHPYATDDVPEDLSQRLLDEHFSRAKHPEITNLAITFSPTTSPTVPGSVNTAPNVLIPSHFAVYPY
jgi:hypothetical protein